MNNIITPPEVTDCRAQKTPLWSSLGEVLLLLEIFASLASQTYFSRPRTKNSWILTGYFKILIDWGAYQSVVTWWCDLIIIIQNVRLIGGQWVLRCLQAGEFTLIVINSTVDTMPQEHQTIFNKRTVVRTGEDYRTMTQHVNKIKELYVLIGPEILRTFAWYFWHLSEISSPSTFK